MQQLDFYIGNPLTLVPPPDNWTELQLELAFLNEDPGSVFNATQLTWKGSNAFIINKWFQGGLSAGYGIFEGIPLVIKVCNSGDVVFNGIIDLTDTVTKFQCDEVAVKIRDFTQSQISLLDGITFAFLAAPTNQGGAAIINPQVYPNGDYVAIPYIQNNIPDWVEFFTCILATYQVIQEAIKVVNEIIGLVTGAASAGAVVGLGGLVAEIVNLIFWVIELVAIILILINLIQEMMLELIGPSNVLGSFSGAGSGPGGVYQKLGMPVTVCMQKICQYFGWQFSSSILQNAPYSNLVWMPTKQAWADNRNQGYVTTIFSSFSGMSTNQRMMYDDVINLNAGGFAYGYPDGTCGDFIRALEDYFCAKARIILLPSGQPQLNFERWDFFYQNSTFTIPNISEVAPFPQPFATNASELAANYLLTWAQDTADVNTYDAYEGTTVYAQTSSIHTLSVQNNTLMNLTEVDLACAQGLRKTQLTTTESLFDQVWNALIAVPNGVISAINGIISLVNKVLGLFSLPSIPTIPPIPGSPLVTRIGHLLLSGNTTSVPKLMLMTGPYTGFLDTTNRTPTDPMAARNLMKNFHYSKLPLTVQPSIPFGDPKSSLPGSPYYNQYYVYKDQEVPLCCQDFVNIQNKNYVKTFDGHIAMIESVKWNAFHGTAKIDYRVRQQYTSNLKTTFIIDGNTTTNTL
jgi:hypothetical protein